MFFENSLKMLFKMSKKSTSTLSYKIPSVTVYTIQYNNNGGNLWKSADIQFYIIKQLMIKVRVRRMYYISLCCLSLLLTLVRYVKLQDVSRSSWRGAGNFQQGNYPDQLHAETAGAVHRVLVGPGGPVISDCSIIPDLVCTTQPLPTPHHPPNLK